MDFVSTRSGTRADVAAALTRGLAPDGGLYVPSSLPRFEPGDFDGLESLTAIGRRLLAPFFDGSPLATGLDAVCAETFVFPIPLLRLEAVAEPVSVLELFHGPTAAFKDVGARFLAASLQRLEGEPGGQDGGGARDESADPLNGRGPAADPGGRPLTILVATSGDTGGAVAAAFHERPGIEVVVLFPLGRVSPRQQHQLTCWGGNVASFGVRGSFDDCQRMVKQAFTDPELGGRWRFSSANSINVGRLLPQSVYYASASLEHWRASGATTSFVVPTGNLGNGLACVLARAMGLPIGDIVFATNANRTLPDYLATGVYEARDSIATLASAMDVGDPSNLERLRKLFGEADALGDQVTAMSVSDREIERRIAQDAGRLDRVWCPHSATAMHVYDTLPIAVRSDRHWAVVATAHPAKFDTVVEPLIESLGGSAVGRHLEPPPALAALLERPARYVEIEPTLDAFAAALAARRAADG